MNQSSLILLTYLLFTLALASVFGCAPRTPTFADLVLAEGNSKVAIAKQWEEGKNDSQKGEKQVLKGRKLVDKGRADLREGEQLVASGNVAVRNNRQAFQGLSKIAQSPYSAEVASERAAKLEKYAEAWKEGEETIAEGNKLVRRGNARVAEGESEIREGQRLIEQGREKMQDAENKYKLGS